MRLCKGHKSVFMASDPELGRLGYLVIDTTFNGLSVGGVRILPDISLVETSHMARTQTKKYLFTGLPFGGAKAAMFARGDRRHMLHAFGRALAPFIQSGFYPGLDMGSTKEDIKTIFRSAGCRLPKRVQESAKYTAWTVIASIDVALERQNMDWNDCRFAVEGFGGVGSEAALIAEKKGARVVAISNKKGCLADKNGLDVQAIMEEKSEHGSSFIDRHKKIRKEKIFSVDCDVFVPCARSWSINRSNVNSIKANIVSCGSNVPMEIGYERLLCKKTKIIIPDAIANCGGALGATLCAFMGDEEIKAIVEKRFKKRVHTVLDSNQAPSDYLDGFCKARKQKLAGALSATPPKSILGSVKKLAGWFIARPYLERILFPED